nr:hypothetical protein [Candidatus Freyarchaeota archaeon]
MRIESKTFKRISMSVLPPFRALRAENKIRAWAYRVQTTDPEFFQSKPAM